MQHDLKREVKRFDLLAGVLVVLLLFTRLFFGVDFTDESQYVGQAILPFINGHFFQNDLFIQQLIYLFFTPVTKLYIDSFQFQGIFFFFRLLYFIQALLCGYLVFIFCKSKMGSRLGFYMGLSLIAFIPFSIPSISYNNAVLHLLPVISTYILFSDLRSKVWDFLISFLVLVVSMSYPPIVLALFLILCLRIYLLKDSRIFINENKFLGLSLLINGVLGFCLLYGIGLIHLEEALKFSSSFTDTSFFTKSKSILLQLTKFFPYLLCCLLTKWIFQNKTKLPLKITQKAEFYLFLLVYFFAVFKFNYHHPGHLFITVTFIFFYIYEAKFLNDQSTKYLVMALGFSAIICSFFSSNRIVNSCIPLLLPTVLLLDNFEKRKIRSNYLVPFFVFVLAITNFWFVYGDANFLALNTRIKSGPFRNLMTTPDKAAFLTKLEAELTSVPLKGSKVLALHFPAIYSFGSIIPETRMLYIHDANLREQVLKKVFQDLNPDFVFVLAHKHNQASNFALETLCRAACSLVNQNMDYKLYQRSP